MQLKVQLSWVAQLSATQLSCAWVALCNSECNSAQLKLLVRPVGHDGVLWSLFGSQFVSNSGQLCHVGVSSMLWGAVFAKQMSQLGAHSVNTTTFSGYFICKRNYFLGLDCLDCSTSCKVQSSRLKVRRQWSIDQRSIVQSLMSCFQPLKATIKARVPCSKSEAQHQEFRDPSSKSNA